MRLIKSLITFGACYNNRDFDSITEHLNPKCEYQSFDCLYKLTSPENVVNVLKESTKHDTSAYNGFCSPKGVQIKRLRECVLICDDDTFKCIRIIGIKVKRRKIFHIIGFDPEKYDFTRGKKIGD